MSTTTTSIRTTEHRAIVLFRPLQGSVRADRPTLSVRCPDLPDPTIGTAWQQADGTYGYRVRGDVAETFGASLIEGGTDTFANLGDLVAAWVDETFDRLGIRVGLFDD